MTDSDFDVYAMKLQPGSAEPDSDPYGFCRSEQIIGIGWGGGIKKTGYESAEEIHQALQEKAERRDKEGKETEEILSDGRLLAPIRYILKEMGEGDLVWVNEGNEFGLCEIQSDWRVSWDLPPDQRERYSRRDIQFYREVDWNPIPYEFVPGFVRRKFSEPIGTLQQMTSGITEETKILIMALHSQYDFSDEEMIDRETAASKIEEAETMRIFDILGQAETEDIVISYLQSRGWRVVKSSTSNSQAKIECELRKAKNSRSVPGYVQVKTGNAGLNPDTYQEEAEAGQMFFFVQSGVDVSAQDGMQKISAETIHQYMISHYNELPNEPLIKLNFALD